MKHCFQFRGGLTPLVYRMSCKFPVGEFNTQQQASVPLYFITNKQCTEIKLLNSDSIKLAYGRCMCLALASRAQQGPLYNLMTQCSQARPEYAVIQCSQARLGYACLTAELAALGTCITVVQIRPNCLFHHSRNACLKCECNLPYFKQREKLLSALQ